MICPGCQRYDTSVVTSTVGVVVTRVRCCVECGSEWQTLERVIDGTVIRSDPTGRSNDPKRSTSLITSEDHRPLSDPKTGSLFPLSDPDPPISDLGDHRFNGRGSMATFAEFWQAYPRKQAKAAAMRAWRKKRPDLMVCLRALEWQRQTPQWQDDQVIPHASTWINQARWEDEPTENLRPAGISAKTAQNIRHAQAWIEQGEQADARRRTGQIGERDSRTGGGLRESRDGRRDPRELLAGIAPPGSRFGDGSR